MGNTGSAAISRPKGAVTRGMTGIGGSEVRTGMFDTGRVVLRLVGAAIGFKRGEGGSG